MTLDDDQIKQLTLDLLKGKSKRDKQTKIGPSGIGNPCDYCLACSLIGGQYDDSNPWWLGAKIGTSVHSLMEHEITKHVATPMESRFNVLKDANVEARIFITYLPGYGNIYGNSDLRLTTDNLIDWKTTKKDKIKYLKMDGLPEQYIVQQMLYAYGWNQIEPGAVTRCSLVFIARDGSGDNDVYVASFDYDEAVAIKAVNRLKEMWEFLQSGGDPDSLESHADCFRCKQVLRRV